MKKATQMEMIAGIFFTVASLLGCQKDMLPSVQPNVTTLADTTHKTVTPPAPANQTVADYYVSPSGDDANPGTITQPFKSIAKAYSMASAGKLIYFREGTYKPTSTNASVGICLNRGINGTADKPIRFFAYPGEKPVIDLSSIHYTGGTIWGMQITGNYLWWKGFEIKGLPAISAQNTHSAVMAKDCNHCTFEDWIVHDNNGMGFVLAGNSSDNLILNCDAYNNQDPLTISDPYGNADGFHIGVINNTGSQNTLRGCRSWYNSDDGYDCFYNEGMVIFENCWAAWNGYRIGTQLKAGDGDGFKLGNSQGSYAVVKRKLTGCIAANNRLNGIDLNDGVFAVSLDHCTTFKNANHGIYLNKFNMVNQVVNCISLNNGSGYDALITSQSSVVNCSWKGFSLSTSSFISIDSNQLTSQRDSSFDLPSLTFLQLSAQSAFQYK